MRTLGRLAIAAALIVPVGIAAAPSAQASGGHFDCTNNTAGTVKVTPGLTLTQSRPQRYQGSGIGLGCNGGYVTGGALTFNISSGSKSERCSTLINLKRPQNGQGTIVWNAKDKAGKSQLQLTLTWSSATGGTLSGTVHGTSVAAGKAITGAFTTTQSLKSIPNGGNCSVKKPITKLNFSVTDIQAG